MPESFIGGLLAHLVAHEVGHTLGLRHNFKGSSLYTLDEINSKEFKGKKTYGGSVMDYAPVNIRLDEGEVQGDWAMSGIGAYDMWAIEYGYTFAPKQDAILARVAEPELAYATDEDTSGPDPFARRYDFSKKPLEYAQSQMNLAVYHRERILQKFVKKGDSWAKASRGYNITLSLQTRSLSMLANWVGGVFVSRDHKGDPNGRPPLRVVPAADQRAALDWVIKHAFYDDAFGLKPELLAHMTDAKWRDMGRVSQDATWPIHDRVMGIQASVLTMLMNPTVLRRVYDNEFRVPSDQDALTLPELLEKTAASIWSECTQKVEEKTTARKPAISSLRRNLQREHVERLIDLSMPGAGSSAAYKPIQNLAVGELRKLHASIEKFLADSGENLDAYTRAHLSETATEIKKALDSQFIYNANAISSGGGAGSFLFFKNQGIPAKAE